MFQYYLRFAAWVSRHKMPVLWVTVLSGSILGWVLGPMFVMVGTFPLLLSTYVWLYQDGDPMRTIQIYNLMKELYPELQQNEAERIVWARTVMKNLVFVTVTFICLGTVSASVRSDPTLQHFFEVWVGWLPDPFGW
jgi:hypothetical protein